MVNLEQLRADIEAKRFTKGEIAEALGVSRPTAYKLLSGETEFTITQAMILRVKLGYTKKKFKEVFGLAM